MEFVYNNGGYIELTQPDKYFGLLDTEQPADVSPTFIKPPGEQHVDCPECAGAGAVAAASRGSRGAPC